MKNNNLILSDKNSINIYGSIGYTILENPINKVNILIFADMHDTLPKCDNMINMADWMKSKFNTSNILLEEVSRDNFELEELWKNAEHTQDLKKLYLNNTKIINPIDIRPFLIPFSWEVLNEIDDKNITLKEYLKIIDNFFSLNCDYLKKFSYYHYDVICNNESGNHFMKLKKKYKKFLIKAKPHIDKQMSDLVENFTFVNLNKINTILDDIMEWCICATIHIKTKNIIMHAGLAHTEKVIDWLINHYKYNKIKEFGINKMSHSSQMKGCIILDNMDNKMFGGYSNGFIN